jgi:hypothetical protein
MIRQFFGDEVDPGTESLSHFVFTEFGGHVVFDLKPELWANLLVNTPVTVNQKLPVGRNQQNQNTITLVRLIQFVFFENFVSLFPDVCAATFDDDQFDFSGSQFFSGCNFGKDPVLFPAG